MTTKTPQQIDAEIEALKARIRRLRIQRKVAELAEAERKLLELAEGNDVETALNQPARRGSGSERS